MQMGNVSKEMGVLKEFFLYARDKTKQQHCKQNE